MNKELTKNIHAAMDSKEYAHWLTELKSRYRHQQIKAAVQVNRAMLEFYWELGKDISARQIENSYGSGFYKKLSTDLRREIPDAKGFSENNLRYMTAFYDLYHRYIQNLQQAVGELLSTKPQQAAGISIDRSTDISLDQLCSVPWGHHVLILNKCSRNPNKAMFYIRQVITYDWSRSVLMNFLDTDLFERDGKAVSNFNAMLPKPQSDLAQEITKDPYNFNFLTLECDYREKELKDALVSNITKFLLELGNGFAYMGKEFRLDVGGSEQFLDLLFYHVNLRCYVVVEVKTKDFTPGDLGQLGTYVVSVNHILKKPDENPTLGILICKSKNNILAKYALESSSVPIGVSEYELAKLYPSDFKSSLPTIEEIERELSREVDK